MADAKSIFFGKITSKEVALDTAKWTGLSFYSIAFLFAIWTIFIVPHLVAITALLSVAVIYAAFGYLTSSKLSRTAVALGTIMLIPCIVLSFLFPGNAALPCVLALWAGIRGIEATFKLHGEFSVPPPGDD